MQYFFLTVFIIAGSVHLIASLKHNDRLRGISKVFILSSLLGWYCFRAAEINAAVVLALLFSWLGDIFLIPKGIKWFTAGGISFMISHFFFILSYLPQINFSAVPPLWIVLAALIYAVAVFFEFKALKPYILKSIFVPMIVYLIINGAMNCFAFYQMLSMPCAATVLIFVGAALFFCSDAVLFFVRFNKNTRWKSHFVPMLTYILSEFLITLGLTMV